MNDPFEPRCEPARSLYRVICEQAALRGIKPLRQWLKDEPSAVWAAARDIAQELGQPVPTLARVKRAEALARGHTDYAAKWAYGVAALLSGKGIS